MEPEQADDVIQAVIQGGGVAFSFSFSFSYSSTSSSSSSMQSLLLLEGVVVVVQQGVVAAISISTCCGVMVSR